MESEEIQHKDIEGTIEETEEGYLPTCECEWTPNEAKETFDRARSAFNLHVNKSGEHKEARGEAKDEIGEGPEESESIIPDPREELARELRKFFNNISDQYGFNIKDKFINLIVSRAKAGSVFYPSKFEQWLKQGKSGISNELEVEIIVEDYRAFFENNQELIARATGRKEEKLTSSNGLVGSGGMGSRKGQEEKNG